MKENDNKTLIQKNSLTPEPSLEIDDELINLAAVDTVKIGDDDALPEKNGRRGKGRKGSKSVESLKKSEKKLVKRIAIPTAIVVTLAIMYSMIVFSDIPFIKYWRTIWIETAMSTKSHQWLAEWFFPQSIIDEVMSHVKKDEDVLGGADNLKPDNDDEPAEPEITDILGQADLHVGLPDSVGNTVVVNDIDEGLVVCEVKGSSYKGRIMLVDDPSRVFVGMTRYPGDTGMRILDMMESYDAVAGVNGSGFADPYENGNGGEVVGMSLSEGRYWGNYVSYYGSIVLTKENKLAVGNILHWDTYGNIRDGVQFSPVLIADGEKQVSGSAGYGIQPRTAVGQREDGVIVFLVVDGRDVTYSIGCTVEDMADILLSYGVINASSCDGGASSVIAYKDKVITKNCSANPTLGRILPNAFLVRHKESSDK